MVNEFQQRIKQAGLDPENPFAGMVMLEREAKRFTYRYVRLASNNYELAAPDTADVIGRYASGDDGLLRHVEDLPLGSVPEYLIERAG